MNNLITGITQQLPPQLFELLDHEVKLYEELLQILREEQRVLVEMDIETLISLSKKKENQLLKIRLLDESLQEMMKGLTGYPPTKTMGLSALAAFSTPTDAARINNYLTLLSKTRDSILDLNVLNKRFIEDTLGYLNDAIFLLTGAAMTPSVYGARGLTQQRVSGPMRINAEV